MIRTRYHWIDNHGELDASNFQFTIGSVWGRSKTGVASTFHSFGGNSVSWLHLGHSNDVVPCRMGLKRSFDEAYDDLLYVCEMFVKGHQFGAVLHG